ncbi:MAG TPA: hypothetical protein ENN38_03985 [Actinobacteria bacterium]|nr:hypothetical protein [Actinomycetota bacterium]
MPTYEYRCVECESNFEVHHGINEEPGIRCEFCGGRTKKIFQPVGIVFKGSGFYKTDSKKSKEKPISSSDKSSDKAESKKS